MADSLRRFCQCKLCFRAEEKGKGRQIKQLFAKKEIGLMKVSARTVLKYVLM
jgi:hypothetical protein